MGMDSTSKPAPQPEPDPPDEIKELWRQRTLELRRARASALLAKKPEKPAAKIDHRRYNDTVDAEQITESRKSEIEESERIKQSWMEAGTPLPTKVPPSPVPLTRLCEFYRMVGSNYFTTDLET